jgi:hypothetical protein
VVAARCGRWGIALALVAGCQGEGRDAPASPPGAARPGAAAVRADRDARADDDPEVTDDRNDDGTDDRRGDRTGERDDGDGDGSSAPVAADERSAAQLIARLGAVPAWEGVVQRAQWLARRGQRGVLYGRIGGRVVPEVAPPSAMAAPAVAPAAAAPAVAPAAAAPGTVAAPGARAAVGAAAARGPEPKLVWLIDDTEGEGSLGVRAAFAGEPPATGSRVAVTGAWALDSATGRWIWQAEASTPLPDEPGRVEAAQPGAPQPGHQIAVAARPVGAQLISKAKDNDVVLFQVLAAPRRVGEAWLVGDQLGSPPVAMLSLPGDRASYGGIDFRQPDEVWQLRRGVTYFVKIGRVRRKDPGKPATINARNAPSKLP